MASLALTTSIFFLTMVVVGIIGALDAPLLRRNDTKIPTWPLVVLFVGGCVCTLIGLVGLVEIYRHGHSSFADFLSFIPTLSTLLFLILLPKAYIGAPRSPTLTFLYTRLHPRK
jgi:cytochrome c oxidase assembly factor CtaG